MALFTMGPISGPVRDHTSKIRTGGPDADERVRSVGSGTNHSRVCLSIRRLALDTADHSDIGNVNSVRV
jgi:hypothetical protein